MKTEWTAQQYTVQDRKTFSTSCSKRQGPAHSPQDKSRHTALSGGGGGGEQTCALGSLFPKVTCPAGWTASLSLQLQLECVVRQAFRKFLPLFDQVLIEKNIAETVTKEGIMLPEKSEGKVLQATVIAVDLGPKGRGGEIQPVRVEVEDKVLPENQGIQAVLDNKGYFLVRDGDTLGKYM